MNKPKRKISDSEKITLAVFPDREGKYDDAHTAAKRHCLRVSIDRAIARAVKAERDKIHKIAVELRGIKDQKLPRNFGKVSTRRRKARKAR